MAGNTPPTTKMPTEVPSFLVGRLYSLEEAKVACLEHAIRSNFTYRVVRSTTKNVILRCRCGRGPKRRPPPRQVNNNRRSSRPSRPAPPPETSESNSEAPRSAVSGPRCECLVHLKLVGQQVEVLKYVSIHTCRIPNHESRHLNSELLIRFHAKKLLSSGMYPLKANDVISSVREAVRAEPERRIAQRVVFKVQWTFSDSNSL